MGKIPVKYFVKNYIKLKNSRIDVLKKLNLIKRVANSLVKLKFSSWNGIDARRKGVQTFDNKLK